MKILDSYGISDPSRSVLYEEQIRRCNTNDCSIDAINHRKSLGISHAYSPYVLDELYRNKDQNLISFYRHIYETCKSYDVFIVNHENVYHPEFIKELSGIVYAVLYTGDDPESSYLCSMPYVWAFDHIFCYAVYYDEKTLMVDKLKQWGAKRANLRPYGYEFYTHDDRMTEASLFSFNRDLDIIYIGGSYTKIDRILEIKKQFGKRFHIYGNWGGARGYLSRLLKKGMDLYVKPVSHKELVSLYQKSKIGINMHMSFGPSNLRMWQLPVNGVMQITDNPNGTSNLFELDKEIVCYENDDINQAIRLIDKYLTNNVERVDIAKEGYHKTITEYSFEMCFSKSQKEILAGIGDKSNKT